MKGALAALLLVLMTTSATKTGNQDGPRALREASSRDGRLSALLWGRRVPGREQGLGRSVSVGDVELSDAIKNSITQINKSMTVEGDTTISSSSSSSNWSVSQVVKGTDGTRYKTTNVTRNKNNSSSSSGSGGDGGGGRHSASGPAVHPKDHCVPAGGAPIWRECPQAPEGQMQEAVDARGEDGAEGRGAGPPGGVSRGSEGSNLKQAAELGGIHVVKKGGKSRVVEESEVVGGGRATRLRREAPEEEEEEEELPEPAELAWVNPARLANQGARVENVPSLANLVGLRLFKYNFPPPRAGHTPPLRPQGVRTRPGPAASFTTTQRPAQLPDTNHLFGNAFHDSFDRYYKSLSRSDRRGPLDYSRSATGSGGPLPRRPPHRPSYPSLSNTADSIMNLLNPFNFFNQNQFPQLPRYPLPPLAPSPSLPQASPGASRAVTHHLDSKGDIKYEVILDHEAERHRGYQFKENYPLRDDLYVGQDGHIYLRDDSAQPGAPQQPSGHFKDEGSDYFDDEYSQLLHNHNLDDDDFDDPNKPAFPSQDHHDQSFRQNYPNEQDYPLDYPYEQDIPSEIPYGQRLPVESTFDQNYPSNRPYDQSYPSNRPYDQSYPSSRPYDQNYPSNRPYDQNYPSGRPHNKYVHPNDYTTDDDYPDDPYEHSFPLDTNYRNPPSQPHSEPPNHDQNLLRQQRPPYNNFPRNPRPPWSPDSGLLSWLFPQLGRTVYPTYFYSPREVKLSRFRYPNRLWRGSVASRNAPPLRQTRPAPLSPSPPRSSPPRYLRPAASSQRPSLTQSRPSLRRLPQKNSHGFYPGDGFFKTDFPTVFHMSPGESREKGSVLPTPLPAAATTAATNATTTAATPTEETR